MAIYTPEEIEQFRQRWEGKEALIDEVIGVLRGEGKAESKEEIESRIRRASDILRGAGYPPADEDIRVSYSWDEFTVPVMDLRGIQLANKDLSNIIIPAARMKWACLRNAHLEGANLWAAHLEGADLMGANLEGAVFSTGHLEGAGFKEASLQGALLKEAHLEGAGLGGAHLEGAWLMKAHMEGADLGGTHLESAWLMETHMEGANLKWAHLEGDMLIWVHLEGAYLYQANLEGASLHQAHLEGASLKEAHLEGAKLIEANLQGADFSYAQVGALKDYRFSPACQLPEEKKDELRQAGETTQFSQNDFVPLWRGHFFAQFTIPWYWKALLKLHFRWIMSFQIKMLKKMRWKDFRKHLFNRWFYTNFEGVRIDDADTVMAPDLYRYVKDQQYLLRFKQTHPWIYWIWKILSDCGGKLSVVAFWSAVFVLLFSWLYPATNSISPRTLGAMTEQLPHFWQWLFVSVSIFSNLGIPNIQFLRPLGVVLIISECVLGLMMLGMLISVLQNRFARRS